jgi:hypothetical protein
MSLNHDALAMRDELVVLAAELHANATALDMCRAELDESSSIAAARRSAVAVRESHDALEAAMSRGDGVPSSNDAPAAAAQSLLATLRGVHDELSLAVAGVTAQTRKLRDGALQRRVRPCVAVVMAKHQRSVVSQPSDSLTAELRRLEQDVAALRSAHADASQRHNESAQRSSALVSSAATADEALTSARCEHRHRATELELSFEAARQQLDDDFQRQAAEAEESRRELEDRVDRERQALVQLDESLRLSEYVGHPSHAELLALQMKVQADPATAPAQRTVTAEGPTEDDLAAATVLAAALPHHRDHIARLVGVVSGGVVRYCTPSSNGLSMSVVAC